MPGVEPFIASGYSPIAAAAVVGLLLVFSLLAYLCCEDPARSTAIRAIQEVSREVRSSLLEPERVSRHQAKEPWDQAKEPGDQAKGPGETDKAKEPGERKEYSKETRAEPVKVKDPPPAGGERVEDKRTLLYGRIFGEPEQAMPVIEQMTLENATAECGLGDTLTNAGLAAANLQMAAVLLQGQG